MLSVIRRPGTCQSFSEQAGNPDACRAPPVTRLPRQKDPIMTSGRADSARAGTRPSLKATYSSFAVDVPSQTWPNELGKLKRVMQAEACRGSRMTAACAFCYAV